MQGGFFDFERRCEQLAEQGDPLRRLEQAVDFERFRPTLGRVHDKPRKSSAGRKPWDVVLMFKVLVLQSLYNLGDDRLEYQLRDRVSFMRFLGLGMGDQVPDAKTIWLFRERLAQLGLAEALFDRFDALLAERGYTAQRGSLIDASIVEAPRQRNSREDNARIKRGERPESFDENPPKGRQKDTDARWTKKSGENRFGYKNHINADRKHKLIRRYHVTDAAMHDSQAFDELLDERNSNRDVYADSAYCGEKIRNKLEAGGYRDRIHRKAFRNRPLSERQKKANRNKSKVRARVEHVFGRQSQSPGGTLIRSIGLVRARAVIGLRNLVYNMDRLATLRRRAAA